MLNLLTGTLLVEPRHLLAVNGYNERLIYYGKEDDDLYDRLVASGLRWRDMDLNTIEHIPHSDCLRCTNLNIPTDVKMLIDLRVGACNVKRALTTFSNHILKAQPWTIGDRMTNWDVRQLGDNYWTASSSGGR